ncbi:alpha/beta fold hydrolase [Streptomyces sp. TRM66268-LWL]|uniref:Alpha/beta fold hydrolase n=1 Tax=Streptomyces polyasparticus TaxID=2767826 RepID=A0ABR7SPU4_9ACTN|nr:alpha/beta fold hydrolase [Streptomyces polyasparticus]MBC9716363.1 alpha/beta fold hydrolase [Streptomyces polyasparticus]
MTTAQSAQPGQSASARSGQPAQSAQPAQPGQSASARSGQPAQSAQPAQPAQAGQSAQPGQSARSAPSGLYARTVRGSGPGLLLAHGAGGGIEANYGPILDGLAARHTVVGVDYPGAGDTPLAGHPLSLDELADQLVAAADAEGLDTFALSGYSLGGPVAVRAAVRHPERVRALVLSATFARADTRTELAARIWQELHASGRHELLAQYLTLLAFSAPALNSLAPQQVQDAVAQVAPTIPAGTGAQVDLVRRADVSGELAAIAVPTLVIVTAQDELVAPALQRELAAAIPGARVAELATGHLPFAEQPARWLELIEGFLAG